MWYVVLNVQPTITTMCPLPVYCKMLNRVHKHLNLISHFWNSINAHPLCQQWNTIVHLIVNCNSDSLVIFRCPKRSLKQNIQSETCRWPNYVCRGKSSWPIGERSLGLRCAVRNVMKGIWIQGHVCC